MRASFSAIGSPAWSVSRTRGAIHRLGAIFAAALLPISNASEPLPPPAEPPPPMEGEPLHLGSISLYTENDLYFGGTDRHYTNGFKFSFLTTRLASFTDDPVPPLVQQLARTLGELLPEGPDYKLGLSVGQNLYTPSDISTRVPLPGDRPYAAWLYLGSAFQMYSPPRTLSKGVRSIARLDVIEITLGVVGPAALGRQVQNNVHDLFDVAPARGWHHQLRNEPGLNVVYERRYRLSTDITRGHSGWGADLIPHFGVSLGNVFTYATTGAEARLGYHLPADFGANLIRPTGDSGALRRPPFNAYLFAAVDGRAVARDVTLDGNTWRDSPSVDKKTWVADLRGGLAAGTRHWQLTYTQVVRTREFQGQEKNSVFGSLSLSYHY
jgi:lipid A 3-O-deacylase